eukprot:157286-Chlamydomonas_euryale.AAC.1
MQPRSGLVDNPDIAVSVMGITFNICAVLYMLPMSFGTAANTRIANELGAGARQLPVSRPPFVRLHKPDRITYRAPKPHAVAGAAAASCAA